MEYRPARSRADAPMQARRSGSAAYETRRSLNAGHVPARETVARRARRIKSGAQPDLSLTMQGRPQNMASWTTRPHVSLSDGRTSASQAMYPSTTWDWFRKPAKRTGAPSSLARDSHTLAHRPVPNHQSLHIAAGLCRRGDGPDEIERPFVHHEFSGEEIDGGPPVQLPLLAEPLPVFIAAVERLRESFFIEHMGNENMRLPAAP